MSDDEKEKTDCHESEAFPISVCICDGEESIKNCKFYKPGIRVCFHRGTIEIKGLYRCDRLDEKTDSGD